MMLPTSRGAQPDLGPPVVATCEVTLILGSKPGHLASSPAPLGQSGTGNLLPEDGRPLGLPAYPGLRGR